MASQWIIYALLAAVFAGLVAVFGKIGLKNVDANLATTIRAFVMFMFLIVVILFQKKFALVSQLKFIDYAFIVLAGAAGALSWLFYFCFRSDIFPDVSWREIQHQDSWGGSSDCAWCSSGCDLDNFIYNNARFLI